MLARPVDGTRLSRSETSMFIQRNQKPDETIRQQFVYSDGVISGSPRFGGLKSKLIHLAMLVGIVPTALMTTGCALSPSYRQAQTVQQQYTQLSQSSTHEKYEFLQVNRHSENGYIRTWNVEQIATLDIAPEVKVSWIADGLKDKEDKVVKASVKAATIIMQDQSIDVKYKKQLLESAIQVRRVDVRVWTLQNVTAMPDYTQNKVSWVVSGMRDPSDTVANTAIQSANVIAHDASVDKDVRNQMDLLAKLFPKPEERTDVTYMYTYDEKGNITGMYPIFNTYYVRGKYSEQYRQVEQSLLEKVNTPNPVTQKPS